MNKITEDLNKLLAIDILKGIFGEQDDGDIPVDILNRDNAHLITKRMLATASKSIDHITVIGQSFQVISSDLSSDIKKRILLLDRTGESMGFRALASSSFEDRELMFLKNYEKQYHYWIKMAEMDKKTEIRVYKTIPWIRGTIVDNKSAIFLLSINLHSGINCLYFYTDNHSCVNTLTEIFNSTWDDTRTEPFFEYYEKFLLFRNKMTHNV